MPIDARAPARILLVDDDPGARRSLQRLLERAGYAAAAAASAAEARRLIAEEEPALAVLDLVLPDGDGLSLLAELRATWPGVPALVVTAYVEPRSIVEAMRRGAADYLPKPIDPDELLSACREALRRRAPAPPTAAAVSRLPIVGASPAATRIREAVERLARGRPAGVLVSGEDGVGKTWVARALHSASRRAAAPCLVLSCETTAAPAVDLFGRAGYATDRGSVGGLLAAAQGGTVVLDDVERLAETVQTRLLDWVEGGAGPAPLLIGLTTAAAAASPLIAWLGRAPIAVPPLRERSGDVLPLAQHFLALSARRLGRRFDGFAPVAERDLRRHLWPANVRELRETVERAASGAAGGAIQPEHLALAAGPGPAPPAWAPAGEPQPLRHITDAYIEHVLAVTRGNRTRAARLLGVARETLRARMLSRGAPR